MKFHNIEIPGVDAYMTVASYDRYREIHGRRWRGVRSATGPLFDARKSDAASDLQSRYKKNSDTVIIGCMAREERINDKAYIDAVATIMQRCPNTVFIWTGRHRPTQVDDMLRSHGVFERSHFIGWVDTKLWAHIFDVYVDTFPFASGQTGLEAMAANVPLILLRTPEAMESSTLTVISPLFDRTASSEEEQDAAAEIFKPFEGQLIPTVIEFDLRVPICAYQST